jgi:hypothetical protein
VVLKSSNSDIEMYELRLARTFLIKFNLSTQDSESNLCSTNARPLVSEIDID